MIEFIPLYIVMIVHIWVFSINVLNIRQDIIKIKQMLERIEADIEDIRYNK